MRTHIITAALVLACSAAAGMAADAKAQKPAEPAAATETPAVLDFEMKSLDGKQVELNKYQGKVILAVNVASKCGATPQYEALQGLHEKYKDQGLVVLGFPSNQFGAQEPGSAADIRSFCTKNYGVTFDLFSKIDVNGEKAAPLYKHLTSEETNPKFAGPVKWNFEKFLINREGEVIGRFDTQVEPNSEEVVQAVEAALEKK